MHKMAARNARVIVDSRERNMELIEAIEAKGVDVELKELHVGDYVVSDRVCLERKTISDFENSLMSGRLFEQVRRLKDSYECPILVLEGDNENFRLKSNIINGTIASLYINYGIMVICTYSATNTAEMIASIAKREQLNDAREPSLKGSARAYTHEQFQEYVVGNLPGVGPKLAKSLLVHFKSIHRIASADKEELMKVEKVGKKKAELIYKTLNEAYKA